MPEPLDVRFVGVDHIPPLRIEYQISNLVELGLPRFDSQATYTRVSRAWRAAGRILNAGGLVVKRVGLDHVVEAFTE